MANFISQLYGDFQLAVCLSKGDKAIWRQPEHLWMSNKPQKQTTSKYVAWVTFSIIPVWTVNLCVQLLCNGDKSILLLCVWKLAFVKYIIVIAYCGVVYTHNYSNDNNYMATVPF